MARFAPELRRSESELIVPQTGQESWHPQEQTASERLKQNKERLTIALDHVGERLKKLNLKNEKQVRAWLENHGITNIGPFPVQDVAADRLLSRLIPDSEEAKKLHAKTEKSLEAFDRAKQNKSDPNREALDTDLLMLYLEAQLELALVVDDLSRTKIIAGQVGRFPEYDSGTHLGRAIDAKAITEPGGILWQYAEIKHQDPSLHNWQNRLEEDHEDLKATDHLLVKAAIQVAGGQDPQALRKYWQQNLGPMPGKGKKWSGDMRERIKQEIVDLQTCGEYLNGVSAIVSPDKRTPKPRSQAEIQKKLEDGLKGVTIYHKEEYSDDITHAHPVAKAKSVSSSKEDWKVQMADTPKKSMTNFKGGAPSLELWQTETLEEILPSAEGIHYSGVTQNNVAAFESSIADSVPVTFLGKPKGQEKNQLVQEWIPGLTPIKNARECAPGQLAFLQLEWYRFYERDRNPGNFLVDPKTGKIWIVDSDFTFQAKLPNEPQDSWTFSYGNIPLAGYQHIKMEMLTDLQIEEIEKQLLQQGRLSKDEVGDLIRHIKFVREFVQSSYGAPLPKYVVEEYLSLTDEQLQEKGNNLRRKKLLTEEKIQAHLNRTIIARELIKWSINNLGYACLPAIFLPDGTKWDYLSDPQMFNPGPQQLQHLITMLERQSRAKAA